ncbi:MAG: M50 family metallopeptidase [Acidimicrobiales bacterium]
MSDIKSLPNGKAGEERAPDGGSDGSRPPGRPTAAVGRLVAVVAAGVLVAVLLHAVNVLVVVLAIVAMVMLHELGHFIAAKASGMKVTEYFLGFGPRLWSIRKGETEYGVKVIPAGGYVKIVGMTMLEDVALGDEPRSYRQASFPRRIAVAVAGSTMHVLIALVLCWSYFVFVGAPAATSPYVAGLLHFAKGKSPAQQAGLRPGDQFVSIDGRPTTSFSALQKEIGPNAGKVLHIVVDRSGRLVHLNIRPVNDQRVTEYYGGQRLRPASSVPRGVIGVELRAGTDKTVGPVAAVPRAFGEFGSLVHVTTSGLTQVFSIHGLSQFAHSVATAGTHRMQPPPRGAGPAQTSSSSSSQQSSVMSILGVIEIGSQAATINPGYLLLLLADINLFIGFVNLFPMLPLDGGHVLIAVYERIRSRKGRRYHADVLKLMPVAYVFLAFIVLLGLGALYANIVQPVHLPGG